MRSAEPYPASTYDPEQCPFWPKIFRQNGYVTAQIGKWHTGVDAGTGRDWDWQIVWNRPKYPANATKYYDDQILSVNGAEAKTTPGYSTDNYTQWALDFVRGKHRDPAKPWYLWLCYGGIHSPTTPAPRHQGMHKDDPVPVPADIFPPREGKPDYLNRTQAWSRGADGQPIAAKGGEPFGTRSYADFIHQRNDCAQALDEGVGALIAALKETGQLENTLVVLTADQGFGMGEHGFRMKHAPYDATYRSPLIVSMPGTFPRGKVAPHCVTGADLVVTYFAVAGLELPWPMHGRDLTPLLKAPDAPLGIPGFLREHGGSLRFRRHTRRHQLLRKKRSIRKSRGMSPSATITGNTYATSHRARPKNSTTSGPIRTSCTTSRIRRNIARRCANCGSAPSPSCIGREQTLQTGWRRRNRCGKTPNDGLNGAPGLSIGSICFKACWSWTSARTTTWLAEVNRPRSCAAGDTLLAWAKAP